MQAESSLLIATNLVQRSYKAARSLVFTGLLRSRQTGPIFTTVGSVVCLVAGLHADFADVGYRTARLLGLHTPPKDFQSETLQSEGRRRLFWSSWITSCVAQENASFKGSECWPDAALLPLPADEQSYEAGQPALREFWDNSGRVARITEFESHPPRLSVMAEIGKMFGIW